MWPFNRKTDKEIRSQPEDIIDVSTREGQLLKAALTGGSKIDIADAKNIPAVAACTNMICGTISMIPFKLYKVDGDKVEEVTNDPRVQLLNVNPKDTLDAVQLKRALAEDYLLDKGGYAYIEKVGNKVKSLRYVSPEYIAFNWNADPIFKDYQILVNGLSFEPHQFLKVLRNTKNGYNGTGIVEENAMPLNVAFNTLKYQNKLMKTGGSKKGFIKSPKHLTNEAITALKNAWANLFSDGSENVVVLNEGMEFQESSESSTEMQINESVDSNTKQICEIFGIPPQLLNSEKGVISEEDRNSYIMYCIQPILAEFENALNRDFLLESEKGKYKWAADISEFTKADILKRYQAYQIACNNGFMQVDEVRFKENMEPLGLDFVKLGLQDVLYYPGTKTTFMPNMNQAGGVEMAMEDRQLARQIKEAELEKIKKEVAKGENRDS